MDDPVVSWARVAAFIRQHTHDVRNGLNSLDLESALLKEMLPQGDAQAALDRIRKQVRSLTDQMRSLSSLFQSNSPMAGPMPANALMTIWQEKHSVLPKAPETRWINELGEENVSVDVEMMASVMQELLSNAATFPPAGPISITARSDKRFVSLEMREPKATPLDTRAWGQPFFSTRRGSHGLGLWTARRLVESNHGTFVQHFIPGERVLVTQIILPKVS
jgi:signal transduction histidine kinase